LAFQDILPGWKKPAGTAHALWSARHLITGNFILLNADDYYGMDALRLLRDCSLTTPKQYGMIPYPLALTLSENGSVNRGICRLDSNGNMMEIKETEGINADSALSLETPVSMNIWRFNPSIFEWMKDEIEVFLSKGEIGKEWQIPSLLMQLIEEGKVSVKECGRGSEWLGVTYPEDALKVKGALNKKSL
jgi:NDP-sugar pyrophosphorylase family protein